LATGFEVCSGIDKLLLAMSWSFAVTG